MLALAPDVHLGQSATHLIVQLGPEAAADVSRGAPLVIEDQPPEVEVQVASFGRLAVVVADGFVVPGAGGPGRGHVGAAGHRQGPPVKAIGGEAGEHRVGRGRSQGLPSARIDVDLPAQLLDDALELPQPLDELGLPLVRVPGRRIRVPGPRLAGGAPGGREDARYQGAAAVGAGHLLVAADLAPAASDAGPRVDSRRPGARREHGAGVRVEVCRLVDGYVAAARERRRGIVLDRRLRRRHVGRVGSVRPTGEIEVERRHHR